VEHRITSGRIRRAFGRPKPWLFAWLLGFPTLGPGLLLQDKPASSSTLAPPDTTARTALLEAIRRASPDLAAGRAELEAARARRQAAGFSPPISLTAEIEEVPAGIDLVSAGSTRLELKRDFLAPGTGSAQRALADIEIERATAAFDVADRALAVRADLHLTRAAASALIARRLAAEDSLLIGAEETLRVRFGVGEARYVDVLRLRTERLRVQAERAAAATEARVNLQVLRSLASPDSPDAGTDALVDSAIAEVLTTSTDQEGWPPLPPAPSVDSLLAFTGSVRLAAIDVRRSSAARRLLVAGRRMQVSTSIGAQRFTSESARHRLGATVGFSLSLPFTARAANAAAITAADRDIEAARAQYRAAVVSTQVELASARERYEAARERLALFDAGLLRGAREEREGALAAYRSGQLSLLELLDFERALARAEIGRLQGRLEAARALSELLAGASGEVRPLSSSGAFPLSRTEAAR
jgi:cobalt-zinc-cadmium efflux system outer membrane protein